MYSQIIILAFFQFKSDGWGKQKIDRHLSQSNDNAPLFCVFFTNTGGFEHLIHVEICRISNNDFPRFFLSEEAKQFLRYASQPKRTFAVKRTSFLAVNDVITYENGEQFVIRAASGCQSRGL